MTDRDIGCPYIIDEHGEAILNITSDPAGTVTSRNVINWRRGEYGPYDELLLEYTTYAGRIGECTKITDVLFYDASAGTYRDLLGPPEGSNKAMLWKGEDDSAIEQFVMNEDEDFLYIGTMRRHGGLGITLDASIYNDVAATMVFEFSSSAGFTVAAVTDGTNAGGDMFKTATPAIIEITSVPAEGTWQALALHKIDGIGHPDAAKTIAGYNKRFWCRISAASETDAPLDAVEIEQLSPLLISVADTTGSAPAGMYKVATEYQKAIDQLKVGAVEYWAQSGSTADLNLTWKKYL